MLETSTSSSVCDACAGLCVHVHSDMDADEDDSVSDVPFRVIEDGSSSLDLGGPQSKPAARSRSRHHSEDKSERTVLQVEPELLHSGGVLGDLPALASPTKSPNKYDYSVSGRKKPVAQQTPMSAPPDTPKEFLCELCQRLMTEPVKTMYGNVMEKAVIMEWMAKQGHICPLTGAPLSETDLTPHNDLKTRIRKWILQRSMSGGEDAGEDSSLKGSVKKRAPKSDDEDLYDF